MVVAAFNLIKWVGEVIFYLYLMILRLLIVFYVNRIRNVLVNVYAKTLFKKRLN